MNIRLTDDEADFLRDVLVKEEEKTETALSKATAPHAQRARKRDLRICDGILGQLTGASAVAQNGPSPEHAS